MSVVRRSQVRAGLARAARCVALVVACAPAAASGQANPHLGRGARAQDPAPADASAEPSALRPSGSLEGSFYTDTDSVTVVTPAASAAVSDVTRGISARGGYLVDIVSAASVDIVSTASRRWTEVRHAGSLGGEYRPRDVGLSADASVSSEPDYLSLGAAGRLSFALRRSTLNPFVGYGYAHDTAGVTGTPFSVYSQELARHSLRGGAEFILDGATSLSVSLDVFLEDGDQKKPYRLLPVFAPDVAARLPAGASLAEVNQVRLPSRMTERTPFERRRGALSARFARRFRRAALVLGQRLYADDWGLLGQTIDGRFVLDVGSRAFFWFRARGHLQQGASFWRRAYTARPSDGELALPEWRTGDRELSPLIAGTLGVGARLQLGPRGRASAWAVELHVDTTATHFFDALYLRDRLGELAVLRVEGEL